MRGDPVIRPALEQDLHQPHKVSVDLGFGLERDLRRLLVRTLAEPDADAFRAECLDVFLTAMQVSLDDRANTPGVAGALMHLANKVECLLRVRRAFHVDAHEAAAPSGVRDEIARDRPGQVLVDIESHVRQLHAHVGIEMTRRDLIDHLVIQLRALPGLLGIRDVFAEVVDADGHAVRVGFLCRFERVFDSHAGNEAAGQPPPDARTLRHTAESLTF